ncbi:MAG: 3-isopropylmalate dehydratase large subunit [Gammaproteobacteria bacterium]|nr:3-isopropylmalate dehydratase large subunit [Gammaproteobacteria bacterium]
MKRTLFDKIWDDHVVTTLDDGTCLLYIDRVFLHERTGSLALQGLQAQGRKVRNPNQVFCTMDHIVDTFEGRTDATLMPGGAEFIRVTRERAKAEAITLFDLQDTRQGISHVVAAEQGIALPGTTFVCPDSHTCTLGGVGVLATGVGSSECEHALVTQTLRVAKPGQMRVTFAGALAPGTTAKDIVLHLIAKHSAAGGSGLAVEFAGPAITDLEVEARMTLCNMAVEFSAYTGIIAPDEKTVEYIRDRPYAPEGDELRLATEYWSKLRTEAGAEFDAELTIDCSEIGPTVTWGTSPQHAIPIDGIIPDPENVADSDVRNSIRRALIYMDLKPGSGLHGTPIQSAFIGSCTNSRLSDLRLAANILKGRKVKSGLRAICVPGSTQVKLDAEKEGLDQIFRDAGFEWRESGCSMCFYAGGEGFAQGERVISSTNRNFEGRQGPGVRSHLASPATVAASAVMGCIYDFRRLDQ